MYQWAEGSGDISWSSPASDGNNGISKRIDEQVIRFGLWRNYLFLQIFYHFSTWN